MLTFKSSRLRPVIFEASNAISRLGQYRCITRPTFAPQPIPDVKHIAQNPGLYEQNCILRNYPSCAKYAWEIAKLKEENLRLTKQAEASTRRFRELQRDIREQQSQDGRSTEDDDQAIAPLQSPRLQSLRSEAKSLKQGLEASTTKIFANEDAIQDKALSLPNLSSTCTPDGSEPVTLGTVRNIPTERRQSLKTSHVDIGTELGILDFTKSATTSGWGWYFLIGAGEQLEHALVQYARAELVKRQWQLVSPPSMVYSHIANACGFQPRDQNDEQQIYRIEDFSQKTTSDVAQQVLAGTAEIPLAAMHAKQTLQAEQLPMRKAAVSRCYRAEAGARGADTKGLYRVHEFTKVEMFAWTRPDVPADQTGNFDMSDQTRSESENVFDEMIDIQRHILTQLGLDFRILEMPSTDLGASATRKIDIEAFFPSRRERNHGWGEVTSASTCTDYQTRRLATRLQQKGSNKLGFPYTLNGTALAVPRVLAALLECHWDEEQRCVTVPEVLRPWMHGVDVIKR